MKSSSKYLSKPHEVLEIIVRRLDPLLNPHGFTFRVEHNSISSGGPFENGFYSCPPVQISLIVRDDKLGCPNYAWNDFHTGHNELIERLGRVKDSVLRFDDTFDKWKLVTTDGRDVIDAFVADLQTIILPAITSEPDLFQRAVVDAHNVRLAKWRSNIGAT
jgi:hypothetical protein